MNKKRIILVILVIALLVAALLYFVPWPTRVNLTLNAAKLDSNGEVIEQFTMVIEGWRLDYLFQPDQLNVNIEPFDDYAWIDLSTDTQTNRKGIIYTHFQDCEQIYCCTSNSSTTIAFCELLFTRDFKYVAFICDTSDGEIYYVASADDQVSYKELAEYFRYLPPIG